jgi:hypothetical protein
MLPRTCSGRDTEACKGRQRQVVPQSPDYLLICTGPGERSAPAKGGAGGARGRQGSRGGGGGGGIRGGPLTTGPSRGEQNDYCQHFVDTGARPQNFLRDVHLASAVPFSALNTLELSSVTCIWQALCPVLLWIP